MGYRRRGRHTFSTLEGSWWVPGPFDPTSLSANFLAVFLAVAGLLNHCVEHTVILNDITQDNNNVLLYKINKTVKFHRLDISMEEAVSTSQGVV